MRVLILGGTAGLGLALARHYTLAGHTVAIGGRDARRKIPQDLAHLQRFHLDIGDGGQVSHVIDTFARDGIDLLIVSAGVYYNTRHHALDAASTNAMLDTNVLGVALAFQAAARAMTRQGHGHLVAIASVAGLLPDYPGASVYAASKRSVLSLCDTFRCAMQPLGIRVTAIAPGYIDTARLRELNDGNARAKPWLMSEQIAVEKTVSAIKQARALAVFPWQMHALVRLARYLPRAALSWRP